MVFKFRRNSEGIFCILMTLMIILMAVCFRTGNLRDLVYFLQIIIILTIMIESNWLVFY